MRAVSAAIGAFLMVVVCGAWAACTSAWASPAGADRSQSRSAAISAYEARKDGLQSASGAVDIEATCPANLVDWQRMPGVDLCTSACTSDADCALGERCRVLYYDGIAHTPKDAIYADDVPEVFDDYEAQRALLDDGLVLDDPPVCEGECSGAPGLPIHAVAPVALCDPLVGIGIFD